jgi:hypothetical protein
MGDRKTERVKALNLMKHQIQELKSTYKVFTENGEDGECRTSSHIYTGLFDIDIDYYGRQNEYEQSFNEVFDCLLDNIKERLKNEYSEDG